MMNREYLGSSLTLLIHGEVIKKTTERQAKKIKPEQVPQPSILYTTTTQRVSVNPFGCGFAKKGGISHQLPRGKNISIPHPF